MSIMSSTIEEGVLTVLIDSPPVNALGADVRRALGEALDRAEKDDDVRAVILRCAGQTFFAGADIREFDDPDPPGPHLPDLCDRIEMSAKPVIAAMHGTVLGGGLEVALACHYRLCVRGTKLGLPEVTLGILPGAGGTQRLPRLIGPAAALDMIVTGSPVGAERAKDMGLVDQMVEKGTLAEAADALAREAIDRDPPRTRDMDGKIAGARASDPDLIERYRSENARRLAGRDAPQACIEAVAASMTLPFDEGIALEQALFLKLVAGEQSAALRHIFFAERKAAKVDDIPADTQPIPVERVGILGAGTMGGGIAMNFLSAGIPVTIVEREQAALDRGIGIIRKNYEASAKKGRISAEQVDAAMSLLTGTLAFEDLAGCDLIIEAVFELMDIKKDVFARLDTVAKPGAILATNTSFLDVDEIAAVTSRPEMVLGMHFFSPANVMKLLEVVRGDKTAPQVLATVMTLARKIRKVAVVAGVCHGFIGNRMLEPRQDEAMALLLEGTTPAQVDKVCTDFGMPMGPFQMGDLAGLDVGWDKRTSSSSTILEVLCEQGRLGQKTGSGFYDYDEKRRATPSPETQKVIDEFAAKSGKPQRRISDTEILERLLYPMVNEGAKILAEGKAQRASDIDVVWVYGYGWPAWRGGPMFWADRVGLSHIVEALDKYAIAVAPLMRTLAAEGRGFADMTKGKTA